MLLRERAAASPVALVAAIVFVVAVAGVGVYYYGTLSPSSGTGSGDSTTSVTFPGSRTSTQALSTTGASTPVCANTSAPPAVNIASMVQQYPRMSIYFASSSSGGSSNSAGSGTFGYAYLGTVPANGTTYYKIDASISSSNSSSSSSFSGDYVLWVTADGTISTVEASYGGQSYNFTGSQAQSFAFAIDFFGLVTDSNYFSSIFMGPSYVHQANSSTISYGPTSVQVTTYLPNSLPYSETYCGETASIQSLKIDLGTASGRTMLTELQISGSSTDSSSIMGSTLALKLLSIATT